MLFLTYIFTCVYSCTLDVMSSVQNCHFKNWFIFELFAFLSFNLKNQRTENNSKDEKNPSERLENLCSLALFGFPSEMVDNCLLQGVLCQIIV